MNLQLLLAAAITPVLVLIYYIRKKDRLQPEPAKELIKAFGFGVLSVFLSLFISIPFGIIGLYSNNVTNIFDAFRISFFGAAIPEEAAKLFCLWIFLRKNKYFDEKMDGIVYAVCVSMGFAALENIMYLLSNNNWLTVGVMRAIFSIPGHFGFGILMGYYYSLANFYPKSNNRRKYMALTFLAPVLAHCIFNTFLFTTSSTSNIILSILLVVFFILFCRTLWKDNKKRIEEHIQRDIKTMEEMELLEEIKMAQEEIKSREELSEETTVKNDNVTTTEDTTSYNSSNYTKKY